MAGPTSTPTLAELVARYSEPKRRTIDVAHQLFSTHGVGGTSLQMIADDLGVTKAAVYHQFRAKDEIVLAVIEVQLAPLEAALTTALEQAPGPDRRLRLLSSLIEVAVTNRSSLSTLQSDPVLFRLLGEHPPSQRLWREVVGELLGDGLGAQARIRASVIAAILGTVSFPLVADLDDATLRAELIRIATPLLTG